MLGIVAASVFAGIAIGVMLMAIAQRSAPRLRARLVVRSRRRFAEPNVCGIEEDDPIAKRPPMKVLKFRIVREYRGGPR
jgi:hypothetical protein